MFTNQYGEIRAGFSMVLCVIIYYVGYTIMLIPYGISILVEEAAFSPVLFFFTGMAVQWEFFGTLCDLAVSVCVIVLFKQLYGLPVRQMGLARSGCFKEFALGGGIGMIQMAMILGIMLACKQMVIVSVNVKALITPSLWMTLLYYMAVAFCEELMDRGFMMTAMKTTRNRMAIYLVPAVLFAMQHIGYGFFAKVGVFVGGLVYAVTFVRTGKLWMSMGFHFAWNFGLSIFLGEEGDGVPLIVVEQLGSDSAYHSVLILADLLLLAVVVTFIKGPQKREWTMESALPFVRSSPAPERRVVAYPQPMPYNYGIGPSTAAYPNPAAYDYRSQPAPYLYGQGRPLYNSPQPLFGNGEWTPVYPPPATTACDRPGFGRGTPEYRPAKSGYSGTVPLHVYEWFPLDGTPQQPYDCRRGHIITTEGVSAGTERVTAETANKIGKRKEGSTLKIIDAAQVHKLLDAKSCLAVMQETLADLEAGKGVQYLRSVNQLPSKDILAFMPACLAEDYFGAKVITVFPGNHGTQYPSHLGTVLLFDAKHGSLLAMLDGTAITQIRTGAVSAVATGLLACREADSLALIGCGDQARSHLNAIRHVRGLRRVTAYDPSETHAANFVRWAAQEMGIDVIAAPSAREAVRDADIICTLTPCTTPVLEKTWIKPGAHINAVGACLAADRELPSDLVAASRLYCDSMDSILHEGGDFLIPRAEGLVEDSFIVGTIGQLLLGSIPGRGDEAEITIFESLGLAIEDISSAKYVYEQTL